MPFSYGNQLIKSKYKPFLAFITVLLSAFLLTACGFSLRGTTYKIPVELQKIHLASNDPNGQLTRALRNELRLNNVLIVNDAKSAVPYPSLRVVRSMEEKDTVSIFMNGKSAEYQLRLTVEVQLMIPERGIYPITVRIDRSFFDNPLAALQKNSEEEIIRQEMRKQAAQEIVRRLSSFQFSDAHEPIESTPKDE